MGRDVDVGHARQFLHVGAQFLRAERTIEADAEGVGVHDADPEGFRDLPAEGAPAGIGDRPADHHRHPRMRARENLFDREQCRLCIQRVKDRFDEQNIGAAVEEAPRRFGIRGDKFLICNITRRRIIDFRRQRRGTVGRPKNACHVTRARGIAHLERVGNLSGKPSPFDVQFVGDRLHSVVGHCDRRRVERIGLENVGAGVQIGGVNGADQLWLRECEQVVVPAQITRPVCKSCTAIGRLVETFALDHGAHRAIEQQNALQQQVGQQCIACFTRVHRCNGLHFSEREGRQRFGGPLGVLIVVVVIVLCLNALLHAMACAGSGDARSPRI